MRKPRSAAQAHRERFAWKFKRASRVRDLGSFLPFAVINWPVSLVSPVPLHSTEFQLNRKPPPARYQPHLIPVRTRRSGIRRCGDSIRYNFNGFDKSFVMTIKKKNAIIDVKIYASFTDWNSGPLGTIIWLIIFRRRHVHRVLPAVAIWIYRVPKCIRRFVKENSV